MAHPMHEHREHKVQHSRVSHLTKGYAHGGMVHSDEAEDKKLIKSMVKPSAIKMDGKKGKKRLDRPAPKRDDGGRVDRAIADANAAIKQGQAREAVQNQLAQTYTPPVTDRLMGLNLDGLKKGGRVHRAKGGRIGKGKTVVNVVVAGKDQGQPPMQPQMAAMPPQAPAPVPPPHPPMMPPGAGMPPGAMPPGMPPRKHGGRAYATGGAVKDGPAWKEGLRNGSQVTHAPGKNDTALIDHSRAKLTRKTGGKVEAGNGMGPKMRAGADTGEGRLEKTTLQKRK